MSRGTVCDMASRPTLTRRTASLTAAAAAAALAGLVEFAHLRSLARDEDLARLRRPLDGRPLPVTAGDGTKLHAEVFGPADGHTVVLAHGWTEQLTFWGPVIGLLTGRGHRVVAYDLRGHGRSDAAVDGDYSLERFGDDLAAVLEVAVHDSGHEQATVGGHSLGGMSIAAWAARHDVTAHADAAVLVNTGFGDLLGGHLLLGQLAAWANHPAVSRAMLGSRAPIPRFSTPLSHALIRYTAFGPTASRGDVAFYERMLMQCAPDARAAIGIALSDMDLWDAMERLTIPTLVVAGCEDRLTPPAHARRLAAELPDPVRLLELADTGHMSPLERPRELAEAIDELVASVSASPDAVPAG